MHKQKETKNKNIKTFKIEILGKVGKTNAKNLILQIFKNNHIELENLFVSLNS